jgi:hypothetical protein
LNVVNRAVITGDIEKSTRLSESNRLLLTRELESAFRQWNKDFSMTSELYRGDSLQCLLQNPADSLRMALILKTFIKGLNPVVQQDLLHKKILIKSKDELKATRMYDIRLAIGIGKVDKNHTKIVTAYGDAFVRSGRALDELKNRKVNLGIATEDTYEPELKTELILLDALLSSHTVLQSEVVCYKLLGYTEKEIGKKLAIGQSAVNQRSSSSNWHAIEAIVNRFEYIYN